VSGETPWPTPRTLRVPQGQLANNKQLPENEALHQTRPVTVLMSTTTTTKFKPVAAVGVVSHAVPLYRHGALRVTPHRAQTGSANTSTLRAQACNTTFLTSFYLRGCGRSVLTLQHGRRLTPQERVSSPRGLSVLTLETTMRKMGQLQQPEARKIHRSHCLRRKRRLRDISPQCVLLS
jgi:hypothetical protein